MNECLVNYYLKAISFFSSSDDEDDIKVTLCFVFSSGLINIYVLSVYFGQAKMYFIFDVVHRPIFFFHSLSVCFDKKHAYKNNRICFNPTPLPCCHLLHLADSRSDPAAPSNAVVLGIYGPNHTLTPSDCLALNLSLFPQLFPVVTLVYPLMQ